jgi:hypothetical protein
MKPWRKSSHAYVYGTKGIQVVHSSECSAGLMCTAGLVLQQVGQCTQSVSHSSPPALKINISLLEHKLTYKLCLSLGKTRLTQTDRRHEDAKPLVASPVSEGFQSTAPKGPPFSKVDSRPLRGVGGIHRLLALSLVGQIREAHPVPQMGFDFASPLIIVASPSAARCEARIAWIFATKLIGERYTMKRHVRRLAHDARPRRSCSKSQRPAAADATAARRKQ